MPKDQGDKPGNLTWNQKESGNDDGTECQKSRETSRGNPTPNQKQPGNYDGTECQKTRETSPGTLPRTRWNQEMMMEQNARRVGRQAAETLPQTRSNQEIMMEQNAAKVGRQAPEPYPEPDGTRKWWWNRMPKEQGDQKEPGNDDGTECQKSKETSPRALPGTKKSWWNKDCFLEDLRTPFTFRAVWGKSWFATQWLKVSESKRLIAPSKLIQVSKTKMDDQLFWKSVFVNHPGQKIGDEWHYPGSHRNSSSPTVDGRIIQTPTNKFNPLAPQCQC